MFWHRALTLTFIGLQGLWITAAQAQTAEQLKEPAKEETKKEATKESPADPSGTWKWQFEFGENKMDARLKLDWNGKKMTGKYTAREAASDIRDAKLEKDELSFITRREFNGNEFEIQFKGQVKQDEIVGKVTLDFGEAQEFDWNAKRAVEIDDVLGVWDLRLESADGVIEPRLTITKADNGKLPGESVSVMGRREAKNLTLKDNVLAWQIAGDDAGREFKIHYKGKPRGNRIEGTNEFDFGGNTGTMKFTGQRTPPEEKKKEQRPAEAKPAETVPATEAKPAAAEPAKPAATDAQ